MMKQMFYKTRFIYFWGLYVLISAAFLITAYCVSYGNIILLVISPVILTGVFLGFAAMYFNKKSEERTAELGQNLKAYTENVTRLTSDHINNAFSQHEQFHYLKSIVNPAIPLPSTRGWAASPDFLSLVFREIIRHQPAHLLELGSGVSTLFIGHLIKNNALNCKLHSVDHSSDFGSRTLELLKLSGVESNVSFYHAPITVHSINGVNRQWYDISSLQASDIGLLIIDGPIGTLQEKARYPALPLLYDRLKTGAVILLDDYFRPDETAMVQDWLREYPALKLVAEVNTEKGTAVLVKG